VQELIEADRLLQRATKTYDVATLSDLITDDFQLVSSSGKVYDRSAFLEDIADRSVIWELNEPEDVAVRQYASDCAIVTAVLHCRFQIDHGQERNPVDVRIRYADLWVKRNGRWLYAFGHAARM